MMAAPVYCTVAPITQNSYTLPPTAAGNVLSADADFCGSGSTLLSTATLNSANRCIIISKCSVRI